MLVRTHGTPARRPTELVNRRRFRTRAEARLSTTDLVTLFHAEGALPSHG